MGNILEIKDLQVRYGGIQAVQGVSLDIPRGSIVTLIGANGAGKSSIIRSIAGLNKHIGGDILLTRHEGEPPVSLRGLKPEDMVRKGISLSPEGRRILPHLSVEENLLLGAYSRSDSSAIAEDLDWVYTLFPRLKERNWQKGGTLSGGEQQRVALARAFNGRPDVLFADEPTGNLDRQTGDKIADLLFSLNREHGTTLIMVTHDLQLAARCDRCLRLVNGQLQEET